MASQQPLHPLQLIRAATDHRKENPLRGTSENSRDRLWSPRAKQREASPIQLSDESSIPSLARPAN
jgi:hypothetical protein